MRLLAASSSSKYELSNSDYSAGGLLSSSNTSVLFQSVGPIFTGQSQSTKVTTANLPSSGIIHGLHISSEISSVSGFKPYSRRTLDLGGNQNGIIVTQMEFRANIDGVTVNLGVDTNPKDGWGVRWDTISPIPRGALVKLYARAFDGLSWGAWFHTQSFFVDNEAPKVTTVNLTALGQMLNSGLGSLNYKWGASDNLPATLSISVQLDSNRTNPKLFSGLRLWLDAADTTSLVYLNNKLSRWMDKSGYGHDAVQEDTRQQPDVETWSKGVSSVRFTGDSQFLSVPPKARGQWVSGSVFVVFKPGFQSRSVNPALVGLSQDRTPFWGLSVGGNLSSVLTQRGTQAPQSFSYAFAQNQPYVLSLVWKDLQEQLFVNRQFVGVQQIDTRQEGVIQSPLFIGAFNAIDDFFTGDIAEVLMFNRSVSDAERQELENYLAFKWTNLDAQNKWVTQNEGAETSLVSLPNQTDNTWYVSRLTIRDKAGNETVTTSILARTPNRTPPVLGIVNAGAILSKLDTLRGTEDISSSTNITSYKWSANDFGQNLYWRASTYTKLENPYKSSEELLKNVYVQKTSQNQDMLSYIVSPNANTGEYLGGPILPGNRYGKETGFIKLTLIDRDGNTVTEDIRVHLTAVNDPPFFRSDVTDGSLYRNPDTRDIVYNLRINENTKSAAIRLDDFIDDVDDQLSSLTVTVSGNALYQVGSIPFNSEFHSKFESKDVTITVGNAASHHAIVVEPAQYWYGNLPVTINISDNKGALSKAAQSFKIRVWPVNQPPIISSSVPTLFTATEDNKIVLNLHAFKNDNKNEDEMPTFNNSLKWSVASYNSTFIVQKSGEGSIDDIITLIPSSNRYGTTNITLKLTDTDTRPLLLFSAADPVPYVPNPLSTTVNVTLVWKPVNDAPEIATVSAQVRNEDSGNWDVDLGITDPEDAYSDIDVAVTVSTSNFFTYTFDKAAKRITFIPRTNAFGTANVTVLATDKDEHINFTPYTPNPKSSTKSFIVQLNAVNDTPSIATISSQTTTPFPTKLMVSDTLRVFTNGYADVGYANNQALNVTGSEYIKNDIPALNYYKNTPLYNYVYTSITNNRTVTVSSTIASAVTYNVFNLSSAVEGTTLNVLVYPNDKYLTGTPLTKSFRVNSRPTLISPSLPLFDAWQSTTNVSLAWGNSTDADGDTIYHRLKIWLVDSWFAPAPTTNIDSAAVYDSGWQPSTFTNYNTRLPDGNYYWAVYASNKFSPTQFDYRDPLPRITKFHVDTTAFKIVTFNSIVYVKELNEATKHRVEDAGNTRVLYGSKPTGDNYNIGYKVYLESINNNAGTISTSFTKIAEVTSNVDWSFSITYPRGTTTYNIFVVDQTNNTSNYQTFTIVEDTTPPSSPTLNTRGLVRNLSTGIFEAISSANYFQVTGNKEVGSAVWYSGVQLVGFTSTDVFSAFIYPEKSTGRIYLTDRSGNQSGSVTININFIRGAPGLTLTNQSRTVVNSPSNPLIANLSSVIRAGITQATLSWTPARALTSYQWVNSSGTVIASGGTVAQGATVQTVISGDNAALSEGSNALTLKAWDLAKNLGTMTASLTLRTKAPTTNLITSGEATFTNGKWRVDINGNQLANATVQILVNGASEYVATYNNNTWKYFNTNFDLANKDIVLKVTDDVYNESTRVIWDHRTLSGQTLISIASLGAVAPKSGGDILQPYYSLPANMVGLFSKQLDPKAYASRTGLSVSTQQDAFTFSFDDPSLTMPASLQKSIYQIYAKSFDNLIATEIDLKGFDIKVGIPFNASASDVDKATLTPVFFNSSKGVWEKPAVKYAMDVENSRVVVTIDKTGVWGLAQSIGFVGSLDSVLVYPNPWVPNDSDMSNGTIDGQITFSGITNSSVIRIYTISGQLVREVSPGISLWKWDGKNSYGKDVASGVYIYLITDGQSKKTGKLTIIR